MFRRLLFLALLCLSVPISAEEVLLVETRNDFNERDDCLYLEIDDDDVPVELVHRAYDDVVMGVYRVEDLTQGVVLRKHRGKAVLKLKITDFQSSGTGTATLTYLKGIIPSARYGVEKFDFKKHKGRWRLFRVGDNRPVKRLFFQANFSNVLGIPKPTGIKRIRFLRDRV